MAKQTENSKPDMSSYTQPLAKVQPSSEPEVDPHSYSLEKFRLYETRAVFIFTVYYLFGVFYLYQMKTMNFLITPSNFMVLTEILSHRK